MGNLEHQHEPVLLWNLCQRPGGGIRGVPPGSSEEGPASPLLHGEADSEGLEESTECPLCEAEEQGGKT